MLWLLQKSEGESLLILERGSFLRCLDFLQGWRRCRLRRLRDDCPGHALDLRTGLHPGQTTAQCACMQSNILHPEDGSDTGRDMMGILSTCPASHAVRCEKGALQSLHARCESPGLGGVWQRLKRTATKSALRC